jgi:YHS domain-containing protein
MSISEKNAAATAVVEGEAYHFYSPGCKVTFETDPAKFAQA